jgi:hypothetical protein
VGAISPFLLFSNFLCAASGDYSYGRRQQGKDNFFVVAHSRAHDSNIVAKFTQLRF